jgi:hypothetical protein
MNGRTSRLAKVRIQINHKASLIKKGDFLHKFYKGGAPLADLGLDREVANGYKPTGPWEILDVDCNHSN